MKTRIDMRNDVSADRLMKRCNHSPKRGTFLTARNGNPLATYPAQRLPFHFERSQMAGTPNDKSTVNGNRPERQNSWEVIREIVGQVRFGTVTLVIHQGLIVQIERTEKIRLEQDTT